MSYGMSYDDFWNSDLKRIDCFMDACEIRQRRNLDLANFESFLNGRYVYEAILAIAPVLVTNPKPNAKTLPYPKKPIDLFGDKKEEMTPELKAESEALMVYFNMKMLEANERAKEINAKREGVTANE